MMVAKMRGPRNPRETVTMEGGSTEPWKELPDGPGQVKDPPLLLPRGPPSGLPSSSPTWSWPLLKKGSAFPRATSDHQCFSWVGLPLTPEALWSWSLPAHWPLPASLLSWTKVPGAVPTPPPKEPRSASPDHPQLSPTACCCPQKWEQEGPSPRHGRPWRECVRHPGL